MALAVGVSRTGGARTPEERIDAVARTIKCPVCPAESVYESRNSVALNVKAEIARLVRSGQTDDQIRAGLAARYGDDVLLVPSTRGIDALVWVLPVALLVACAAGLVAGLPALASRLRRRPADGGRPRARRAGAAPGLGIGSVTDLEQERLEEERQFLLASLTDLEQEHEAGDITDGDYRALKDDYTARAAAVLRAIEEGRRPADRHPSTGSVSPRRWSRTIGISAAVVAVAIGAGVLVARFSGQRLPGQTISGGIAEDTNSRLAQARALLSTDPGRALELYTQVKQVDPDNVEATTYAGWLLTLQAASTGNADLVVQAEGLLDDAIRLDPGRADAHCFKAVVRFRFLNDPAAARPAVDRCQALNPPAALATEVAGLAAEIDTALATAASSPPTTTP